MTPDVLGQDTCGCQGDVRRLELFLSDLFNFSIYSTECTRTPGFGPDVSYLLTFACDHGKACNTKGKFSSISSNLGEAPVVSKWTS